MGGEMVFRLGQAVGGDFIQRYWVAIENHSVGALVHIFF
jgi:hypothetical protein